MDLGRQLIMGSPLVRCVTVVCGVAFISCDAAEVNLKLLAEKREAAETLHRAYVLPLALKGAKAHVAVEKMIVQGFQCGIVPANHIRGIQNDPYISCERSAVDQGELCPIFHAALVAIWPEPQAPRSGLLTQLQDAVVEKSEGSCPGGNRRNQVESEAPPEIAQELTLVETSSREAFERLISMGFRCGFELGASEAKGDYEAMICHRIRRTESCLDTPVRLSLAWSRKPPPGADLLSKLAFAKVQAQKLGCVAPDKGRSN